MSALIWKVLITAVRQEKEIKDMQMGNEEIKQSLFAEDVIVYRENKASTKQNQRKPPRTNKFNRFPGYKTNTKHTRSCVLILKMLSLVSCLTQSKSTIFPKSPRPCITWFQPHLCYFSSLTPGSRHTHLFSVPWMGQVLSYLRAFVLVIPLIAGFLWALCTTASVSSFPLTFNAFLAS